MLCSPDREILLDESSREGSVAYELASLSVSPISAVRPVQEGNASWCVAGSAPLLYTACFRIVQYLADR